MTESDFEEALGLLRAADRETCLNRSTMLKKQLTAFLAKYPEATAEKDTVRLDWSSVDNNSSSIDAVVSFARGMSLKKAEEYLWDPKAKALFRDLRKLPVKDARRRARMWMQRHGVMDYFPHA